MVSREQARGFELSNEQRRPRLRLDARSPEAKAAYARSNRAESRSTPRAERAAAARSGRARRLRLERRIARTSRPRGVAVEPPPKCGVAVGTGRWPRGLAQRPTVSSAPRADATNGSRGHRIQPNDDEVLLPEESGRAPAKALISSASAHRGLHVPTACARRHLYGHAPRPAAPAGGRLRWPGRRAVGRAPPPAGMSPCSAFAPTPREARHSTCGCTTGGAA